MKNKYSIALLVLILILVGCFAVSTSGIKISYIENYGTNFRRNVKGITDRFGLNLPKPIDDFLSKTPEPLTTEEKLEIIEKMEAEQAEAMASPTPEISVDSEEMTSATSKIVAVKNAYAAAYASYKSMLLCASDTLLTCYGSDSNVEWQADIQTSSPILRTAGNYIMVAEKSGNKVYLFNNSKKLWENTVENQIVSADVSENGDVVIVADKSHYKGAVTVINRNGDVVFQWNSGKYEIIDADISPASRKLAVSLLNTDSGADTRISFFDINESESFNSADITDSIVFDLEFCGETLNAVADNKIVGLSSDGVIKWTEEFGEKVLHRYKIDENGYKLCVFDNNNVSQIEVITNRGKTKYEFESQTFPAYVFILDGKLLYNDERRLYFSPLSGKNPKLYNCTRDIYDLLILDSENLAVVYNSSIEFVKF